MADALANLAATLAPRAEESTMLGKNSSFKIYKPAIARLVVKYLGFVRRELGFKYRDSIRVAQSRPSEMG